MDLANPARRRELCAERSQAVGEPVGATASRADHWLLVEYRGRWAKDVVNGSLLSPAVKAHLHETVRAVPNTRLLFIRRTERRRHMLYRVALGSTSERDPVFHELDVDGYDALLELDLAGALAGGVERPGAEVEEPFYVVCTHGKRDRCCAKFGRPLYEEVCRRAGPERVWQASHVGGDRFAGNLVCFPHGLFFGHVLPADVEGILDRLGDGAIELRRYRGRCCYPFTVQAAELAAREETGIDAIDAFAFLSVERLGEAAWLVRLEGPDGEVHEVDVVGELADEEVYLTCSASRPQRVRRFVGRSRRPLAAR